jgi:hypothetical protein
MLKKVAILAVVLVFASLPAFSDSIDLEGSGSGGTWSWNGSGALTATSLGMAVKIVGSTNNYTIYLPDEVFTSGAFLGGSGSASNPWTFGPGSSGSFTITGCVPPQTTCTPSTLFSGQFASAQTDVQGSSSMLFTATSISGTINSALLSFLGLPASNDNYSGTYSVTLDGSGPGSGLVASGDLVLSAAPTVPEPATLLTLSTGVLALALLAGFRRKQTSV